jgi:hypothetical protein
VTGTRSSPQHSTRWSPRPTRGSSRPLSELPGEPDRGALDCRRPPRMPGPDAGHRRMAPAADHERVRRSRNGHRPHRTLQQDPPCRPGATAGVQARISGFCGGTGPVTLSASMPRSHGMTQFPGPTASRKGQCGGGAGTRREGGAGALRFKGPVSRRLFHVGYMVEGTWKLMHRCAWSAVPVARSSLRVAGDARNLSRALSASLHNRPRRRTERASFPKEAREHKEQHPDALWTPRLTR